MSYAGYLNPSQLADGGVQPESAISVMAWNCSLTPLIVTSLCFPLAALYYVVVERKYKKMGPAPVSEDDLVVDWSDGDGDYVFS